MPLSQATVTSVCAVQAPEDAQLVPRHVIVAKAAISPAHLDSQVSQV